MKNVAGADEMNKRLTALILCLILVFSCSVPFVTVRAEENQSPASDEILNAVYGNNPNKSHPRLLVNSKSLKEIKQNILSDAEAELYYNNIIGSANEMLGFELMSYDKAYESSYGRKVLAAVKTLGMGWLLTKNEVYAEKVWEILEGLCGFPSWCERQRLDLGPCAAAAAIGFDWCYDYFGESQKNMILNAISDKALNIAKTAYKNNESWTYSLTNWNSVINAGVALCALAVADETGMGDLAGECLEKSMKSISLLLKHFEPNGAWDEGVTYWEFTLEYAVYYIAALESACGTDFGLFDLSNGFKETILFPLYIHGPCGRFNYGDAGIEKTAARAEALYFAKRLSDPSIASIRLSYLRPRSGGGVTDLIWYDKNLSNGAEPEISESKCLAGSSIEIPILRSGYGDNERFLAVRGGDVSVNHGHHDSGSFVFDADGTRWAMDLGGENYYSDYFKSERFNYYRTRPEGHNTLVINPGYDDNINKNATVKTTVSNGRHFAYSKADLSEVYPDAVKILRGTALYSNKKNALIQDEISLKKSGEIYWFMHTDANIAINGNEAVLQKDGKYLKAKLLSPAGATFKKMSASPLPSSPKKEQSANEGISKLAVHLENVKDITISVALVPLEADAEANAVYPLLLPIDRWMEADSAEPQILKLDVCGKTVCFNSDNTANIFTSNIGTPYFDVKATGYYSLIKPVNIPGTATISVGKSKNDVNADIYKVNIYSELYELSPVFGDGAEYLCDGDKNTYKEAAGKQFVFEFEDEKKISGAYIFAKSAKNAEFNINISDDGKNWSRIFCAGRLDSGENVFKSAERKAKYIRLTVFANECIVGEIGFY